MLYVILIIVALGIIGLVIEKLKDLYGFLSDTVGKITVIITVVLCIIAFFAYSWKGVFIVAVAGICISLLVKQFRKAGMYIGKTIENHDKEVKATAQINQNIQLSKEMHANEVALQNELDKNCRWLGYTNEQMWAEKLTNYKDKRYSESFQQITQNFAMQMEQQNITQNDAWFQPFLMYIINHPQGSTVTKMLNEVNCPQFYSTHATRDYNILHSRLVQGTKRVSKDVPPILNEVPIAEIKESLYVPTEYALKLYGTSNNNQDLVSHKKEISFDDL